MLVVFGLIKQVNTSTSTPGSGNFLRGSRSRGTWRKNSRPSLYHLTEYSTSVGPSAQRHDNCARVPNGTCAGTRSSNSSRLVTPYSVNKGKEFRDIYLLNENKTIVDDIFKTLFHSTNNFTYCFYFWVNYWVPRPPLFDLNWKAEPTVNLLFAKDRNEVIIFCTTVAFVGRDTSLPKQCSQRVSSEQGRESINHRSAAISKACGGQHLTGRIRLPCRIRIEQIRNLGG